MSDGMSTISVFVWVGVLVGYAALMIHCVNCWYGRPLPHQLLGVIRSIHALSVPVVWIGLWYAFGWELSAALDGASTAWWRLPTGVFLIGCCLITFVLLPCITVHRLLRHTRALVQNHTRTVDIAERLGFEPLGHSRYRSLATLPGNQVFQIDLAEKVLRLSRLPAALDGLRILHLSDLHFIGTPDREYYQAAMDLCREWDADIVALTGDVVDSEKHLRWILPILSRLRWRIAAFAIWETTTPGMNRTWCVAACAS
jgi:hypothetical protein